MNTTYLKRLKDQHGISQSGRAERLRVLPFKTMLPYIARKTGLSLRSEARTFFDRCMQVVIPEPVSVTIWRYGFFEQDVCFFLLSLLRRRDTFIDIGGHFGFFSMLARELVGSDGTVITFEPMPGTRTILIENMEKHAGPTNYHLIPGAAGAVSGRLKFKDFGLAGSAFATSAMQRSTTVKLVGEVEVEVKTLDSVVAELGLTLCRLIKIDAENAEYDVVKGSLGTIRTLRPAIVLEAGDADDATTSTRRVVDLIMSEGYEPFEFRDWYIHPHAVTERYGYQNLLMVPAEKVGEMVNAG